MRMRGFGQSRRHKISLHLPRTPSSSTTYKKLLFLLSFASVLFLWAEVFSSKLTPSNVSSLPDGVALPMALHNNNNSNIPALTTYDATIPWSNVSTMAYYEAAFYSGFRNQMMAFTIIVFLANEAKHGQILLQSIQMKDTYGTNDKIPFDKLWDVAHWNSYYPQLPRLVRYNESIHMLYNPKKFPPWNRNAENEFCSADESYCTNKPDKPASTPKQAQLMGMYVRYGKGTGPFTVNGHRQDTEKLMLQQAMRPHPALQDVIHDNIERSPLRQGTRYMTLHARIEPDMQKQRTCWDKKVVNLTDIFRMVYNEWPEPPVSAVFLPVNRETLEQGAQIVQNDPSKTNWIAVENLRVLNEAKANGMWNGRVPVVEFGAKALDGTSYASRPSTSGAMLNYFIAMNASIFVGSEVSSYAHDLLASRFFRGMGENYKYLPSGLVDWTPPGTVDPPGFHC